uniref:Uncharacterized protein n=1 Tax=viral metagenome TaxID=1070528 RepID=A0A6C0DBA2_9ZZZZ
MSTQEVPSNFKSIINDFTRDLTTTFPEYSYLWSKWSGEISDDDTRELFGYILTIYPTRFFDILYENDTIFKIDDETDVSFLPNVNFRLLYNCEDITENTKKSIWKYLQLILFSIVGAIKDKTNFGDTSNIFEGINENELQDKLAETMNNMTDFFKNLEESFEKATGDDTEVPNLVDPDIEMPNMEKMQKDMENAFENIFKNMESTDQTDGDSDTKSSFPKMSGLPDIKNIHEHLKTLFEGKIGKLAKEMAEEISEEFSSELGEGSENIKNTQDAIKHLMKDPTKLMGLMKKVGNKLDSKMESGEISRDELMKEAQGLLGKMKDMGGGDDLSKMFKEMAKKMGMGNNVRINKNALNKITKMEETREKMKSRALQRKMKENADFEKKKEEIRKRVEEQQKLTSNFSLNPTNATNEFVFRLEGEDKQEKSFIHPDLIKEMQEQENNNGNNNGGNKKKKKKTKK